MCFSATASFATATMMILASTATMTFARGWRELPLASIPFVFGIQQAIEGMLWLELADRTHGGDLPFLTNLFAAIALSVWPLLSPVSALLVENVPWRRVAMGGLIALGALVAFYGALGIHQNLYGACVVNHAISYAGGPYYSPLLISGYLASTVAPMLLSSLRTLRIFGAILALGFCVSLIAYYEALVSAWCFFAAISSSILVFHFIRSYGLDCRFPARNNPF